MVSVGSFCPFFCTMSLLYMMTLMLPGFHSEGRPYCFPSNDPPKTADGIMSSLSKGLVLM